MKFSRAAIAVTVTVVALGGLMATGAEGQSGNDPGVTQKTVKLGYIYPGSGFVAPSYQGADKAFQARIDRQNAQGGVNGRKIVTEIVDDKSSTGNLTGAQDLAQNRHVFAVVNASPFAFLSYRFLQDAGVPVIGGLTDGTYYGEKGNENVISSQGNSAPFNGLAYDRRVPGHEEARCHQDRGDRPCHLAGVGPQRQGGSGVRRAGCGPQGCVHERVDGLGR